MLNGADALTASSPDSTAHVVPIACGDDRKPVRTVPLRKVPPLVSGIHVVAAIAVDQRSPNARRSIEPPTDAARCAPFHESTPVAISYRRFAVNQSETAMPPCVRSSCVGAIAAAA